MKTSSVALFVASVAATSAWFIACGGGSPGKADAATCDCPAAEPPIAGRVMSVAGTPVSDDPGTANSAAASCPQGAILLTGGCSQGTTSFDPQTVLLSAGPSPDLTGWICVYQNNRPSGAVPLTATAVCLMPAQ